MQVLEVLKYIFSSFWIWLGSVILLSTLAGAITGMMAVAFGRKVRS